MSEVKERPIPFSGPMVRAILDDRKTVTRRAVKKPPVDGWAFDGEYGRITSPHPRRGRFGAFIRRGVGTDFPELDIFPCPYGMPGDRLWVRETLHYDCEQGHYYAAGGKHADTVYLSSLFDDEAAQTGPSYDGLLPERSVPSIHLHRQYSRILLEVTDVRIERLQDITDKQAQAEGVVFTDFGMQERPGKLSLDGGKTYHPIKPRQAPGWHAGDATHPDQCLDCARFAFANLWEKTGGNWDANPWVWCVEFRRVQP